MAPARVVAPSERSRQGDGASRLRQALADSFPEVNRLWSDAYLDAVMSVPGRSFEYARDEKLRKALKWRRDFGVDSLRKHFSYDMEVGTLSFVPDASQSESTFMPSPALVRLCQTRALRVLPNVDADGRLVLLAETRHVNWSEVTAEVFLQHHVLVLEAAFDLTRSAAVLFESVTLLVDQSGPSKMPPLGALIGMVGLLQTAYPDRIHRICVGPVNFTTRGLFRMLSPLLAKRSRDKIKLVGVVPSLPASGNKEKSLADSGTHTA